MTGPDERSASANAGRVVHVHVIHSDRCRDGGATGRGAVARFAAGTTVALTDSAALRIARGLVGRARTVGGKSALVVGFLLGITRIFAAALAGVALLLARGTRSTAARLRAGVHDRSRADRDVGSATEAVRDIGHSVVRDDVERHRSTDSRAVAGCFALGFAEHRVRMVGFDIEYTAKRDRHAGAPG